MVVGVGVDLVEIERVAHALERWDGRFLAKIMGPEEVSALPPDGEARTLAVASAIAAKEAASKCIGTGWSRGVRWRDVVVTLLPEPRVELFALASDFARRRGSEGRSLTFVERRGDLVVGQVFLLS